jgi:prepilin-type N-terminal cleavage/methylation domain-containing protein/prepilin-type processing-associated H-X9-DG protein
MEMRHLHFVRLAASGKCASGDYTRGDDMNIRNRSGFTLIELLVVIAIISILAAILFPVFARAREKARQITCASNEKQLALAILQYNQDYDENFPAGVSNPNNPGVSSPGEGLGWAGEIYSYVKSTGTFKCPDDSTSPTTVDGLSMVPVSYSINCNIDGGGSTGTLASLNAPASTILLVEVENDLADITGKDTDPYKSSGGVIYGSPGVHGNDGVGLPGWINSIENEAVRYATGPANLQGMGNPQYKGGYDIGPRHTDGSNFAFADGHVKYEQPSYISQSYNATTPNAAPDMGNAAGTGYIGQAPQNFIGTFSAI